MYNGLSTDVPFSVCSIFINSLMMHFRRVTSFLVLHFSMLHSSQFAFLSSFTFFILLFFEVLLFYVAPFSCFGFSLLRSFRNVFFFSDWTFPCCSVLCRIFFSTFSMLYFFLLHFPKAIRDRVSWCCTKYDKCIYLRKPALN